MLCPAVRAVLCWCRCPCRTPSPSTIPLLPACRGCIYPPEQQDLCDTSPQGDGSLPNFLTGLHKFFLPLGAGINDSTASEGFSSRSDSKICTTPQQLSLAGGRVLTWRSIRAIPAPLPLARESVDGQEGAPGEPGRASGKQGRGGQAAARVKCAVCPGATRCPCGKGLGAARGRERQRRESRESRESRELREWSRGHLCLSAPTPGLALPQAQWPREALLDAGEAPGSRREGAWNAAAPGCS